MSRWLLSRVSARVRRDGRRIVELTANGRFPAAKPYFNGLTWSEDDVETWSKRPLSEVPAEMFDGRHMSFTQSAIGRYFGDAMHDGSFPRPLYRRDDGFVWAAIDIFRYIEEARRVRSA